MAERSHKISLFVVFLRRLSSIKGCLPSKDVFHLRLSLIKDCLQIKVVFEQRLSLIKGHLPSKVSSIKWCCLSKIAFCQILCSTNGHFPQKAVFHYCIKCVLESSKILPYHPTFLKSLHKLTVTGRHVQKDRQAGVELPFCPRKEPTVKLWQYFC